MKEKASRTVTAKELRQGVRLSPSQRHRLEMRPNRLSLLELEDLLFGLNSAVLLPYPLNDDGTIKENESGDIAKAQGLGLVYVTYRYLEEHPKKHLLITGHTDTSGEPGYNLELSRARAENVHALLMGQKRTWADVADTYHRVEDIQLLLTYYSVSLESPQLDPGSVDNQYGEKTEAALEAFQRLYNETRRYFGLTESAPITVDGVIGPETWGAFYDLYLVDLAQMLGCAPVSDNLQSWREQVRYAVPDRPYVGLGESFPVEQAYKDEYRSQENRRVELLFFDENDVPTLPSSEPSSGTYSKDECPIYDPSSYQRAFIEADELFAHSLELQTVDEAGAPVGNVSLTLEPVLGDPKSVQSDGEGYCKVGDDLPPGRVRVLLDDDSPAQMRFQGELQPAVLRAQRSLDSSRVTSVIVEAMTDEERQERDTVQRIYGNLPEEQSPSTAEEEDVPEPFEAAPESSSEEEASPAFHAHDNLMLVAANPEEKKLQVQQLYDVLETWLHDQFPQIKERGAAPLLLDETHLRCLDASGRVKHEFPLVNEDEIVSPFGAYALYTVPGGRAAFVDMSEQSYALTQEGLQNVIPIHTLLSDEDASTFQEKYVEQLGGKIPVLYYTPRDIGKLRTLAMNGGAGYLEEYADEKGSDLRKHIHQRNQDTLRFVRRVYEGQIQKYVEDVKAIGEGTTLPEEASTPEKQARAKTLLSTLHAMGPPPSIYKFPMPAGATETEKDELNEAGAVLLAEADYDRLAGGYDPLSSEYQAWQAVSKKIDDIYGRHSQGGVFLKADFSIADAAEDLGVDNEFTFSIPGTTSEFYFKLGYEKTLEVGTDGAFVAGSKDGVSVDYGVRAEGGPVTIELNDEGQTTLGFETDKFEIAVEGEVGAKDETGLNKIVLDSDYGGLEVSEEKVNVDVKDYGVEVSEDGTVTLKGALGTSASYNCKTKEFGYGWDPPLPGVDYLGLHMKGIYEETIRAYLVRAPGFFERRLVYEFYNPTLRWNDLTSRERMNLRMLGWNETTWDRRGENGVTYEEDFPESARTSWFALSTKEKHAALRLGMNRDDWSTDKWKASASGSAPGPK